MKLKNIGLLLFLYFFNISCNSGNQKPAKLIITIVVDQMRPDLLTRYEKIYNGGFKWLIDNGAWYSNTHHEHSYTATGPGHTAIGFGQYPGKIGVLGNSFYDRDLKKKINCVEDPNSVVVGSSKGKARSFSRYNASGLGDWLQESSPSSKVISIGGKDRTACILGGKNPTLPLYYNQAGHFITSSFYRDKLPEWVSEYNSQLDFTTYKDSLWIRSLDEKIYTEYSRADFYYGESDEYNRDTYSPVFPIGIDSLTDPNSVIMGRPWFEKEVLKLSLKAIIQENLGQKDKTDLLFVGLSAMDWIIHDYGPYSQEAMDAFIKLDIYLGEFIQNVEKVIGLDNVLFILTADHGGLPLPEYLVEKGKEAGRINKAHLNEALSWVDEECIEKYGRKFYYRDGSNFYLHMNDLKRENVLPNEIFLIVKKHLLNVKGIGAVIDKAQILESKKQDKITRRIKNMLHETKSPEIFVIQKENFLYRSPYGTSHGSPYDYDTHVPLIFSHKNYEKHKNHKKVETVDIAPTIAKYLGISIPEYCDGKALDI